MQNGRMRLGVRAPLAVLALAILVGAGGIITSSTFADNYESSDAFDRIVRRYHREAGFDGVVLVARGGEIIFEKAYGLANREWNVANTVDTTFNLASVTKLFTATLTLQLVERGKIKLDDPVSNYVPQWRTDRASSVTVRQLLNHTSGLKRGFESFDGYDSHGRYSWINLFELINSDDGELDYTAGSKFRYSNIAYVILARLIEHVTGQPYHVVLDDRILGPAEMTSTGVDIRDTIRKRRASGYTKVADRYARADWFDFSSAIGSGFLYSTASDLFRFDRALRSGRVLRQDTLTRAFTPSGVEDARYGPYGLGWYVDTYQRKGGGAGRMVRHDGGIYGFSSEFARLLDDDAVVVLLSNTGSGHSSMRDAIIEVMFDRKPTPLPLVTRTIYSAILAENFDAIDGMFELFRDQGVLPSTFGGLPDRHHLNWTGYQLLGLGECAAAIDVFRYATHRFPDSWNAWDSLGEGCAAVGDRVSAIQHYRKSLELNPKNTNADKQILSLKQSRLTEEKENRLHRVLADP